MLTILPGNALDMLRTLPADSVQCCVTSPPYWGLRDYGNAPQDWPACEFAPMPGVPPLQIPAEASCLGLEPTLEAFIAHLVLIFDEVRRVLKPDGVCWVNMGDGYHPDKNLIGQPWRVAFALQAAEWFFRQDVIWHKPNPMPESTQDRCTKAHEYLFMLTKSGRYYWDKAAMAEKCSDNTHPRRAGNGYKMPDGWDTGEGGHGTIHRAGREKGKTPPQDRKLAEHGAAKNNGSMDAALAIMPTHRNKRSVWTVATKGYKGAHFATFPPDLIAPCILSSTRVGDTVLDPFGGTFTTAQVALSRGRHALMIEINPDYIALGEDRLNHFNAGLL